MDIVEGMNVNKLGKNGRREINESLMRVRIRRSMSFLNRRREMRVVKVLVVYLYLNEFYLVGVDEMKIEIGYYFIFFILLYILY